MSVESVIDIRGLDPREESFSQVLKLRYKLLDEPVGWQEVAEPSDNDLDPDNFHVGAFALDRLVSAVRADKHDSETYEIRRMVTDPEFQGLGIGRNVLEYTEEHVRLVGARGLLLSSTPGAVGFYRNMGYEQTDDDDDGIWWQGIFYRRMYKVLDK